MPSMPYIVFWLPVRGGRPAGEAAGGRAAGISASGAALPGR